jgi:hypothetical protein
VVATPDLSPFLKCIASAMPTVLCGMSERLQDRTKNSLPFKIPPDLREDLKMHFSENYPLFFFFNLMVEGGSSALRLFP